MIYVKLPNPFRQYVTLGVMAKFNLEKALSDLFAVVIMEYKKQPDCVTDGGNDKYFFSFVFRGVKLFVAANEDNCLTVMLPEEY
jgi:hypothetical protein